MEKRDGRLNERKVIAIGAVVVLCCLCIAIVSAVVLYYVSSSRLASIRESPIYAEPALPVTPTERQPEIDFPNKNISSDNETLNILESTVVPASDLRELACRLNGICNIPEVMATGALPRVIGEKQNFWVHNLDTNINTSVQTTLTYATSHAYFWVQDGVQVDENEVKVLMDAFENKIYPTDREFFGSEWTPGIDGDEHIYIIYARGLGSSVAGYFNSTDSSHPLINEFSNAHETFLFNADNSPLSDKYTYAVLAHEFQHMIHWHNDLNESTWLNEGASELAMFINGYSPGGFDQLYIVNPDLQLNDWPNDHGSTSPHYGAGFLFLNYFLDRFGEDATQLLVKDPANGLESVEDVLRNINATDPITGESITANDFFVDWALTNFILDASFSDGRYIYNNYPSAQRASPTETISSCPQSPLARTVHQYGVDYIAFSCRGNHVIHFSGATTTQLLPVDPYSGSYAFWSNKGDESDMTLTREFDFTNISAPIELSYRTWFDIETDWDYVYLEASEDGNSWKILLTPSGTGTDPSGNSYGWAYTGKSGDWLEEKIDLSQFAGKKIFLRFEYITDGAVNGEGFLLDDVSVEAAGYRSDFEADNGGWESNGFVRVQNVLPQTFGLALILTSDSSVTKIPLDPSQEIDIPISLKPGEMAYLVVTGLTRVTRELASYQIEVR